MNYVKRRVHSVDIHVVDTDSDFNLLLLQREEQRMIDIKYLYPTSDVRKFDKRFRWENKFDIRFGQVQVCFNCPHGYNNFWDLQGGDYMINNSFILDFEVKKE